MLDEFEEHGEEEGEPWLVSYADMVTLLFGLFVILFSLSHLEEQKFAEFGRSIAAGFSSSVPKVSTDGQPAGTQMLSEEQQQMRAFQMLVAVLNLGDPNSAVRKVARAYEDYMDGKSTTRLTETLLKETDSVDVKDFLNKADKGYEQRLTEIVVPSDRLFAPRSATLLPQAKRILDSISKVLLRVIDTITIQVESNTDKSDFAAGDFMGSFRLSTDQANAIAVYFIEKGVPISQISSVGRGHSRPVLGTELTDGSIDARFANRRIEIVIGKK